MDLAAEKTALIKRLESVTDLTLIFALKRLLDYGTGNIVDEDEGLLEASIQKGLDDIKSEHLKPHQEVMANLRARYT